MPAAPHDLDDKTRSLSEAFSQDKRPLALLLGAGCPLSITVDRGGVEAPLIPDIAGLTKLVAEQVVGTSLAVAHARLVEILAIGRSAGDPSPNVEEMLSWLRSVQTISGADDVRGISAADVTALEEAIVEHIAKAVDQGLPSGDTPYAALASWAGAVRRSCPLHLFTTNYDLLAEQALETAAVPIFDGFVGVREPFLDLEAMEQDVVPSRWVRLWKLHGSINWALTSGKRVVRRAPDSPSERRLVHPSHLKYAESRRMPYLGMQDQLRAFLRVPSATAVTVGYSFGDEHLNEVLTDGLEANPGAAVFGLLHGSIAQYPAAVKAASTHRNLFLFASDAGLVGGVSSEWADAKTCKLGDFAEFGRLLKDLSPMAITP